MDVETRKYHLIQEVVHINSETILDSLERVLKREKDIHQHIDSKAKRVLDQRIESYKDNPDNVLDWKDVKADW